LAVRGGCDADRQRHLSRQHSRRPHFRSGRSRRIYRRRRVAARHAQAARAQVELKPQPPPRRHSLAALPQPQSTLEQCAIGALLPSPEGAEALRRPVLDHLVAGPGAGQDAPCDTPRSCPLGSSCCHGPICYIYMDRRRPAGRRGVPRCSP
jgi:hypothetical protein